MTTQSRPHPFSAHAYQDSYGGENNGTRNRRRSSGYTDEDILPLAQDDRFSDAAGDSSLAYGHASQALLPPAAGSSSGGHYTSSGNFSPGSSRIHTSSMSASLRGRRAPAPAALDLSPRSERVRQQSMGGGNELQYQHVGLGLGTPAQLDRTGRRAVTDTYAEESQRRVSRPLPRPPGPPGNASSHQYADDDASTARIPYSPSAPLSVPLSAVGLGNGQMAGGQVASRFSVMTGGTGDVRPSLDSYYFNSNPEEPSHDSQHSSFTPSSFAPATPGMPDPATLDRRGLIGTGELATPRWATTSLHPHLRTPAMPQPGSSPQAPGSASVSAPSRNWMQSESGFGLGMGTGFGAEGSSIVSANPIMQENPEKAQRARARAMSHVDSPPKPPPKSEFRGSVGPPIRARDASLPRVDVGDFGDFHFDPNMDTAISASYNGTDNVTPRQQRQYHTVADRGLPASSSRCLDPVDTTLPSDVVHTAIYSPNSARARIYARRSEREKRNSLSQSGFPLPPTADPTFSNASGPYNLPSPLQANAVPQRSSSKYTPPNSAASVDSTQLNRPRDSRKTPPHSREQSRNRPSPSASHHEILKHFAPRDFSHLPPSPSSASINQFLRNSTSTNSFAAVGSPSAKTPPTTSTSHINYFPATQTQVQGKSGLTRSDSQRSQKQKLMSARTTSGWEGRELDKETEEAMRKLDGIGLTPKGKAVPGRTKLSTGPTARPESPTNAGARDKERTVMPPPPVPLDRRHTGGEQPEVSSPLSRWVDLPEEGGSNAANRSGKSSQEYALLDQPSMPAAKRESSSSASFVGTPTSRDSHTSFTTPSSSSAKPDKARRASGASEMSTGSEGPMPITSGSCEKVGELSVPPVPPLPKGYASMRQGMSNAAGPPIMGPTAAVLQPTYQPLSEPQVNADVEPRATVISSPATSMSPASQSTESRPRQMNKKWSFSSALSLRLNKDPTDSPPLSSPRLRERDRSTQSPETWSEVQHSELMSPPLPRQEGSDSSSMTASRGENRSTTSITPVGSLAPPSAMPSKSTTAGKRLTPSSIPFFRRSSSSSVQTKQLTPPTGAGNNLPEVKESQPGGGKSSLPPPTKIPTSGSMTRKSMLGMHLPSMLRGSSSKRQLSQQLSGQPEVNERVDPVEKAATTGWGGRSRGKTMSISGPLEPKKISQAPSEYQSQTLRPKASEGSLSQRSGVAGHLYENGSSQTLRPSKSGLPPISGSPSVRAQPSMTSMRSVESRNQPAPTPTRIPRIASNSRNGSPALSGTMGPPTANQTMQHSRSGQLGGTGTTKTVASISSMNDFSRPGISEFGAMGVPKAHARHASNDPQRSRLLAPMSMRNDPKPRMFAKPAEATLRLDRPANVPPSRRTMPLPPSAAAMTISAQNKRTSRDVKPGLSRHSSKDGNNSGRESSSDNPSPIKPSKSLHSKLNVPSTFNMSGSAPAAGGQRIPSSSSMGAPGVAHRKTSLVTQSANTSPSPAEDEESLADAEMAAYVARRKARAANGGGRKDDLKDIEGFPEDVDPVKPISQRAFISKNLASLSDYERKEALDFDDIYYVPSKRIVRELQDGASYNHGYDDERGDYLIVEGDHLCYRYEVMFVLGKGSFGQVLQCRDHKTGRSVAVKIIRNKKRFHAQALVEIKILGQLVGWDVEDKHYMVRMTDHFTFRSHLCIVTELLSINLYELIKANQFAGFSTTLIRRFTMQMLSSLQLMRSHRIVHCDLKPENILLRHPAKSGIKVIDFGSSCHETEKVYTYIQSRFYRSPEVILGMNYAMAIDMWSLGCILAELYTGVPIFPGENEHEQLACIMEVLGVPDSSIVNKAQRKKLFFDATGAPRPFVNAKGKRRRPGTRTLAQVLKCNDELFVDFIAKCLTWDPDRRLKPQPAMRHPWILAGRRRYAPPPPSKRLSDKGSSSASSFSTPSGAMRNVLGASTSSTKSNDKKSLVISPPTPLVAKTSSQIPNSAPRMGSHQGASSRLAPNLTSRNSFVVRGEV